MTADFQRRRMCSSPFYGVPVDDLIDLREVVNRIIGVVLSDAIELIQFAGAISRAIERVGSAVNRCSARLMLTCCATLL